MSGGVHLPWWLLRLPTDLIELLISSCVDFVVAFVKAALGMQMIGASSGQLGGIEDMPDRLVKGKTILQ